MSANAALFVLVVVTLLSAWAGREFRSELALAAALWAIAVTAWLAFTLSSSHEQATDDDE